MRRHLPLETPLLLIGALGIVALGLFVLRRWHARKANHDKWQPALEETHELGSNYPQNDRSFLSGMVNKRYTVPKDPQEYAKIFVPETNEKGQAR